MPESSSTAVKVKDFPATRWSLVIQARDASESVARGALEELCRIYWRPVYSFLRRQGNAAADAEDLTQGFFLSLLERDVFVRADEGKGRLRSLLLVAVKRFAVTQFERSQAHKRGGKCAHVSINMQDAEHHHAMDVPADETPELLFDRQWAMALLQEVMKALQEHYTQSGRGELFIALKERLTSEGAPGVIEEVAVKLGMSNSAVRTAVSRLRQRYASLLHEHIAKTVGSEADIREEIAHLMNVLRYKS